ncbi:MAG: hypothetical protein JSS26_20290 [Nitrospira sp.]|nr:hypothetical protein [Nitrospira sp.]
MRLLRLRQASTLIVVLLLSSVLAGCATTKYRCKTDNYRNDCQREYDFYSVASFALKAIERIGPVTIFVVPAKFDAYARGALAELRPVIELKDMPSSGEYSQPKGYFVVEVFSVNESSAEFDGRLGPVPRSGQPDSEGNCGTTFVMPFELELEDKHPVWASHSYKTQVCDSTHFIVPAHP